MAAWIELRLVVPRSQVDELAQIAVAGGASGVQEALPPGQSPRLQQPWDLEPPEPTENCTLLTWVSPHQAERLQALLGAVAGVPISAMPADDTDWEEGWMRHHRVVEVGSLRIAPPWLARKGDLVIPPGQAFGTGDHPTTRSCLEALQDLSPSAGSCLDVGCGSGVLALAANRMGLVAHGVDIDPLSVKTARENATTNALPATFSTEPLEQLPGPYDLVMGNMYAEVLTMLAPQLVRLTGRWLVLAGILWDRQDPVREALSPLVPFQVRREGDWAHLRLRRP